MMMNNLLSNIIEARNIAVFINNVIVRTETKEEHDDIVSGESTKKDSRK